MKPLILAIALSTSSAVVYGQTKAPDFSGIYWATEYNATIQLAGGGELPLTAAGKEAFEKNKAGLKDGSITDAARKYCVPDGLPRVLATPYPFEIVQGPPGQITIIYELNHQVRVVRMDKPMPAEKELISLPYYNGHSVGHFEGDTLVVESAGFNDKTFVDATGGPHTDQMRTIERIRKPNAAQLEIVITVHDPEYYTRDWQARFTYRQRNDIRIEDYNCGDPHRDISSVRGVRRAAGPAAPSMRPIAFASAPSKDPIPELASTSFAWLAVGADWLDAPAGLRGPISTDPDHPFHGNTAGPGQVTLRIGNYKDPVLKPWAAAQMLASNEEVLSGKRGLPFSAQSRCYPGGVPGQLLFPAEPFYLIQTPKQVWMIWQRDHMVRRVYLTDKHSANVTPSWFGESIGHYEDGNTLVVDTIGLSTKNSYIDNNRTPHTEKLHVVERFKLAADARMLEAAVTVEDPDTFNEPLHMVQRWRKVNNPLVETVCAEDNFDYFHQNLFPLPQADKPDF
jgi:hypothetical protein